MIIEPKGLRRRHRQYAAFARLLPVASRTLTSDEARAVFAIEVAVFSADAAIA